MVPPISLRLCLGVPVDSNDNSVHQTQKNFLNFSVYTPVEKPGVCLEVEVVAAFENRVK